jgi:hypothetical protein
MNKYFSYSHFFFLKAFCVYKSNILSKPPLEEDLFVFFCNKVIIMFFLMIDISKKIELIIMLF